MYVIKRNVSKNTEAICQRSRWQMGGKREKCSIMSDKVFFLRFKDHCATLNMFVTFFFPPSLRRWELSRASQELYQLGLKVREKARREGGKKSPFPFILARFPSKATNKLQCTFDTNWFLNSNNNVVPPVRAMCHSVASLSESLNLSLW